MQRQHGLCLFKKGSSSDVPCAPSAQRLPTLGGAEMPSLLGSACRLSPRPSGCRRSRRACPSNGGWRLVPPAHCLGLPSERPRVHSVPCREGRGRRSRQDFAKENDTIARLMLVGRVANETGFCYVTDLGNADLTDPSGLGKLWRALDWVRVRG